MILALDGTAVSVALITVLGLGVTGWFGLQQVKAQVKASRKSVEDKVDNLDTLNTWQHGENAKILRKMLDTISEHGVLVSSVVNIQDRPIIKTDPEGALIQVNAAGVKLLGMTPAELSGDGWVKAVHPEDRHKVFTAWNESVATRHPFGPISYRYLHPTSGAVTLVEAVATPVISGVDDTLVSWVAVVVPITELEED